MLKPSQIEELTALESQTNHLKERYEKEIKLMIDKPLPRWKRIAFFFSGLMGIGFFFLFGTVFFMVPKEFPMLARLTFLVGAIGGLILGVMAFYVVKKGTMNIRKEGAGMVGLIWIIVVFMITVQLILGNQVADAAQGTRMILSSFVFLFMGALFLIQNWIEKMELNLKETILKMELHIAELNEKIDQSGDSKK